MKTLTCGHLSLHVVRTVRNYTGSMYCEAMQYFYFQMFKDYIECCFLSKELTKTYPKPHGVVIHSSLLLRPVSHAAFLMFK